MTLPGSLDPEMVVLAGAVVRNAVLASQYSDLPRGEIDVIVERGVALLADQGAFVRNGSLWIRRNKSENRLA